MFLKARQGIFTDAGDSVGKQMATTAPSESTPQRVVAVREQLKLLSDYL
jgi:hypothetical protein